MTYLPGRDGTKWCRRIKGAGCLDDINNFCCVCLLLELMLFFALWYHNDPKFLDS